MKIFLAGAVSFAPDKHVDKFKIYEQIINEFFPNAELTTPDIIWEYRDKCIAEHPDFSVPQINNLMTDYDLQKVKECDIMICDTSVQSTGFGLELGVALENKIKVAFFYEKGAKVSNMLTGAFLGSTFIEYNKIDDIEKPLRQLLTNLKLGV